MDRFTAYAFSFFMLFFPFTACAEDILSINIWCDIPPPPFSPDADSVTDESVALRELFEEARLIFSGMIYGYEFTYIPLDKARGVEEFLDVKPIAEIAAGDNNLRYISGEREGNRIYGLFTYSLQDFQSERRESWKTIAVPVAIGTGEGKIWAGAEGKQSSRRQAIKQALRNYLRPRLFNKPNKIKGRTLFLECPMLNLKAGSYVSTVKIKIDIKEIIPYSVY